MTSINEKENTQSSHILHNDHETFTNVNNELHEQQTPRKQRYPLNNIMENTPTTVTSSRWSCGKDTTPSGRRGSIFSGAVRVPKRDKSQGMSSEQGNTSTKTITTSRTTSLNVTPNRISNTSKKLSGSGGKGYMQPTEAYR